MTRQQCDANIDQMNSSFFSFSFTFIYVSDVAVAFQMNINNEKNKIFLLIQMDGRIITVSWKIESNKEYKKAGKLFGSEEMGYRVHGLCSTRNNNLMSEIFPIAIFLGSFAFACSTKNNNNNKKCRTDICVVLIMVASKRTSIISHNFTLYTHSKCVTMNMK